MLIDGKRLDQIAEESEIAQTTVVFHLKNLFRKTDTNRQADLIRVLLSVPLRSACGLTGLRNSLFTNVASESVSRRNFALVRSASGEVRRI